MDPDKEKRIRELLAKKLPYRKIEKKLNVSSRDIAKVSKKMRETARKQAELSEYPAELAEEIKRLKAEKTIEELKTEIAKIKAEPLLLDESLLIFVEFLGSLHKIINSLDEQGSRIFNVDLKYTCRKLFMMAKSIKPELFKPFVEKLAQGIGIPLERFVDPGEGWLSDYDITIQDLKKYGLID